MFATAIFIALAAIAGITLVTIHWATGPYSTLIALGVAFGLQKYIASYFGYFVIKLSKPFTPGDRIRIGNLKGDVKRIGLLHFILDEVGEDEKLGGEFTGRTVDVPNLIILDQPVVNYSKNYSVDDQQMKCDLIFDEVRIPVTLDTDLRAAQRLLHQLIVEEDREYIREAKQAFGPNYPNFVKEAEQGPRILVHLEAHQVWLKGKFVTPYKARNDIRANIYTRFLEQVKAGSNIKVA